MKLEAVTVCVNYADFLAHFLLWNKPHFDRLVVVTDTRDFRTHDLCEHHHVECLKTDVFYHDGLAFDKGAGINAGLARLDLDGWALHIDSDIILPPRTKGLLEAADLDERGVYGIDRLMCRSWEEWAAYMSSPAVMHSCNAFIQGNAFPLGVRVAEMGVGQAGYVPIGFFQLWHPGATGRRHYPGHGDAGRGDMLFSKQWLRRERHLLAEIIGIHLESEACEMATNWRGRRSPPFGPVPCPPPHHRVPPPSEY